MHGYAQYLDNSYVVICVLNIKKEMPDYGTKPGCYFFEHNMRGEGISNFVVLTAYYITDSAF